MPKALKKFTLMLDNGTSRVFERGDDVEPELAAHWYAALHCEAAKAEAEAPEAQTQKGDPLTSNLDSLPEAPADGQQSLEQLPEKAPGEAGADTGGDVQDGTESSPQDTQSAPDAQSEATTPARKKPGPKPKAK